MPAGDLIDQAYYQTATGTSADARVPNAITAASSLIRQYLQRSLGLATQSETRTYDYDGSGVVEIDDVTSVTQVKIGAHVLATTEYVLRPRSAPEDGMPYYWLEVAPARGISPEMGFTYNLDQYPRTFSSVVPLTVDVTGSFGWPTVPEAAKEATVWTVEEWLASPEGAGPLSGESVADFSRSWAVAASAAPSVLSALPLRAREALDPLSREAL